MNAASKSCVILLLGLSSVAGMAAPLDEAASEDLLLGPMQAVLEARGIDVIVNLNDRRLARGDPERPRLGRFPDLPFRQFPDSTELLLFERDFSSGEVTGLALLKADATVADVEASAPEFLGSWLQASDVDRVFITHVDDNRQVAQAIAAAAMDSGWHTLLLSGQTSVETAGTLFATAAQRLAIDSSAARDYEGQLPDLAWLGERVRRNSDSIFKDPGNRDARALARSEPAVFVKETLGDEFSESTIREIIVPGGVALGETARLDTSVTAVRYADQRLQLMAEDGTSWQLPPISPPELKSLFDFVQRSEAIGSDAIVDIDGDRQVSLNAALRDTEAGYEIMHADTLPFEYVNNLRVTKSVIVDTGVEWFVPAGHDEQLAFETRFEVRFLSADNMRIAQTRVALEYAYDSRFGAPEYDDAWGRDVARLRENLDYPGLGKGVEPVARYAGWIALWRRLEEDEVRFTEGRYEFMKVDKTGQQTPARY